MNNLPYNKHQMRIALMNMKGGCGKTTVATNLAAYYASKSLNTAIVDYDHQGGSLHWLSQRDESLPRIYQADARKKTAQVTSAWQQKVPCDTEVSILDTPGNIDLFNINTIIDKTDIILIPVMPSLLDMQSAARFIETLLLQGKVRQKGKKVGVIANRIQKNTNSYKILEKFLKRLDIPLVASFRNLQKYVHSQEQGIGVCEIPKNYDDEEQQQWDNLAYWLADTYNEEMHQA